MAAHSNSPTRSGSVPDRPAVMSGTELGHGTTTDGLAAEMASKILRFEDLATCGNEVWIEHSGQLYRLQRTRQGKLILTK